MTSNLPQPDLDPNCRAPNSPASGCQAHKFGGSSLASAGRIGQVVRLLSGSEPQIVIVAAMQGVTDLLVALAEDAAAGRDCAAGWTRLRDLHIEAAHALADKRNRAAFG